jgi:hypothetical protein
MCVWKSEEKDERNKMLKNIWKKEGKKRKRKRERK